MGIPNSSKIDIDGVTYPYVLKGGRHGRLGWSAKTLRLIVDLSAEQQVSYVFQSKLWVVEQDENPDYAAKAAFPPAEVKVVVMALLANAGILPEDFDLSNWARVPRV